MSYLVMALLQRLFGDDGNRLAIGCAERLQASRGVRHHDQLRLRLRFRSQPTEKYRRHPRHIDREYQVPVSVGRSKRCMNSAQRAASGIDIFDDRAEPTVRPL